MRIEQATEAWTAYLRDVRRLSPATVRAYRSDLADLIVVVGDLPLAELQLDHLREWLWSSAKAGLARTTIARRTAAVRAFCDWALEHGLIPIDPSLRLVAPKRGRSLPRIATASAMTGILDGAAQQAADGDPIALRVGNSMIALRRAQAALIEVDPHAAALREAAE